MTTFLIVAVLAACASPPAPVTPAAAPAKDPWRNDVPAMPLQIKSDRDLVVHATPVTYTLAPNALTTDGRTIPLTGVASWPAIAHAVARLPPELRPLLHTLSVSATPSALDAMYTAKYKAPVLAGMTANPTGDITIYPHGIDELVDEDGFVRNLMHELGHTWSLAAWNADPAARTAWLDAIRRDQVAPSRYAVMSFHGSGDPAEDAAEATALYFVTRGTPLFDRYRQAMPRRFALVAAQFPALAP